MTQHSPLDFELREPDAWADHSARTRSPAEIGQASPERQVRRVPHAEVAQLVSLALSDALTALDKRSPEAFLEIRAYERRAASHEALNSLPRPQAQDPTVLAEYRKQIVLEDLALDLGLEFIDVFRRYVKLCGT